MTMRARCTCHRWPHLMTCARAPFVRRDPPAPELKSPAFWQDMGFELGVYTRMPTGEEPTYLAMKLDAEAIDRAIGFLTRVKSQLPVPPDAPLVDFTRT